MNLWLKIRTLFAIVSISGINNKVSDNLLFIDDTYDVTILCYYVTMLHKALSSSSPQFNWLTKLMILIIIDDNMIIDVSTIGTFINNLTYLQQLIMYNYKY